LMRDTITLKGVERSPVNKIAKIVTTYNPQNWYNNLPDFKTPDLGLDGMAERLNHLIGSKIGTMEAIRLVESKSNKILIVVKCDCGKQEFRSIKKWLIALSKHGRNDRCAHCKKARYFRMRATNSPIPDTKN
jgi:hypothetical protein